MALLVALVKRLECRIDQVDGQLAAILKVVHDVGLQVCKGTRLKAPAWPAFGAGRIVVNTSAVSSGQSTSTITGVRSADRSAEQISSAAGLGTDWASMAAASPVNFSNRYAALQTTDDEQADDSQYQYDQYEISRSARLRAKCHRQHSQHLELSNWSIIDEKLCVHHLTGIVCRDRNLCQTAVRRQMQTNWLHRCIKVNSSKSNR